MSDSSLSAIRFYFSFRSPYAWLATERLEEELGDLGVEIERVPVFPTPELSPELFQKDPSVIPNKTLYMVQDVSRLARERGLSVRFPSPIDPDWSISHAAFLGAEREGKGHAFMLEAFRQRFCKGLDLGEDEVIAAAARRADLNADVILSAAHSDELRSRVSAGWRLGIERDRIFGVPSFVYAGKLYWGQDRMHFLGNAVRRKSGKAP